MRTWLLTVAVLSSGACTNEELQRMVEQPKSLPYTANDFFEDGRSMRTPPLGTVPRERHPTNPALEPRLANGNYVDRNPVPLTTAMLRTGRKHFEILCAACHGLLGDGNSIVARKMSLRAPPSLHGFGDRPDGFFFDVISQGYGVMPGYANEIPTPEDRWAVVAYVRALLLSQTARLGDAPPDVQARLLKEPR